MYILYFTSGVIFSLRGASISADGSGHVVITDINPNRDNGEDFLVCHSEIPFPRSTGVTYILLR